jgi:SAM-dependent methyltransferase
MVSATPKPDQGSAYSLGRCHLAACRLNLQHYLWRETLGLSIHAAIKLPPNPVIADIACGTGLWLIDVSREVPDAQLYGFDMNLTQAPHNGWLPSNISLKQWNFFDEVPPDFIGKFDFIHARLLVMVLPDDPAPFVRRLFQLLKPGGYVQWDELDCINMHVRKADSSIAAPALEELHKIWTGRYDWTIAIHETLNEHGFEDATLEYFGDDSLLARAFADCNLMAIDEVAGGLIRAGKEEAGKRILGLVNQAHQENAKGAGLSTPRVICVARKPLQA